DPNLIPGLGRSPGKGIGYPPLFLGPRDFPGKNTGVSLPYPPPGDFPHPGIKPEPPALQ
ncbi:unnamed protein product, partial [Rangifer tarandus platyrhynchus]